MKHHLTMRFPGNKEKALTFSYDDGVEQDIRLVSILDKNGLKGTFNINSGWFAPEGKVFPKTRVFRKMTKTATVQLFGNRDHEVAVHGLTHTNLEKISHPSATYEVCEDRNNIEKLFGKIIRGMAYPYGAYNESVMDVLRSCGIAYARTIDSTRKFDVPTDWLRLEPTCHHNDPELFDLIEKFTSPKPAGNDPWLFYIWGHAYEFESDDNWELIEDACARLGGHNDIWYATNIEIYDYVTAFNSLISSLDGKLIYNPSVITVYFSSKENDYSVAAGETVAL